MVCDDDATARCLRSLPEKAPYAAVAVPLVSSLVDNASFDSHNETLSRQIRSSSSTHRHQTYCRRVASIAGNSKHGPVGIQTSLPNDLSYTEQVEKSSAPPGVPCASVASMDVCSESLSVTMVTVLFLMSSIHCMRKRTTLSSAAAISCVFSSR